MNRSYLYPIAVLLVALSIVYIAPMSAQEGKPDNTPAAETPATPTETKPAETPVAEPPVATTAPAEEKSAETVPAVPVSEPVPATVPSFPVAPPTPIAPFPSSPFETSGSHQDDHAGHEHGTDEASLTLPADDVAESKAPVYWKDNGWVILGTFFGIIIISFLLASAMSSAWRMPEHYFRIFAILICLIGSVAATYLGWHKMTLGIDLRGGVVLIYDVRPAPGSPEAEKSKTVSDATMDALAIAIGKRINPAGIKEISIAKLGNDKIKIIIPEAEDAEVARIRRVISESGALTFRILASRLYDTKDGEIIEKATRDEAKNQTEIRINGDIVARWVPVDEAERASFEGMGGGVLSRHRSDVLEMLVLYNDGQDVTGQFLVPGGTERTIHKNQPAVGFQFNAIGEQKFKILTSSNLPLRGQAGMERHLGIVMNEQLYSAPIIESTIGDRGVITFGKRDNAADRAKLDRDINDLINILNAGSLPAELDKDTVSEQRTGALLGEDTIRSGQRAMIGAAIIVAIFMVIYYHALGLIACFCVLMNLLMIMAIMLAVRAAFTLPGLAGLVLTVGMAVDANILIFERLREEFAGGASMKWAIRKAFDKASTAIVDSNLTTIITGLILYWVGSEQIKGFAVTLVLGVVFSMFTAIYCSRTIMDVVDKNRWAKRYTMLRILTQTNFNFIGAGKTCIAVSLIFIVIGFVALGARGRGILGIDFSGGVAVELVFKTTQPISEVRQKLEKLEDLSVSEIQLSPATAAVEADIFGIVPATETHFNVQTSLPPAGDISPDVFLTGVENDIKKIFGDALVRESFNYEITPAPVSGGETSVKLEFRPGINGEPLKSLLDAKIKTLVDAGELVSAFAYSYERIGEHPPQGQLPREWSLKTTAASEQLEKVFKPLKTEIDDTPYFPTSTTIGANVAKDSRVQATLALILSIILIIIYMRVRFHKLVYGLATAITLVHNVLIVLGLVALSAWGAKYLSVLQVNEFKIDLTMIAAFLTVIGYSLNDTIILFDRIRENKGKTPQLTVEMVNKSINQTLSRTILTSLT
ncbi:MAG: protein translocase subunit SecD, partial [Planctomycetaceae bacterium]|nr:protein translocase subunit SecD [Planctomycetaceae bacterium]